MLQSNEVRSIAGSSLLGPAQQQLCFIQEGELSTGPLKIHPITQMSVLCGPCGSGQLWVALSGLSVEQKVLNTHVVPFREVFPDTLVVGGPRSLQHEDSTWQRRARVAHWGASLETTHYTRRSPFLPLEPR